MPNLLERRAITQATIDNFHHKPFVWGERDCGTLAGFASNEAGIAYPWQHCRKYVTEKGALRAMKELGFSSMPKMVDSYLERIAPAEALMGDIVGIPAEGDEWVALGIYLGEGRILAFADLTGDGEATAEIGPLSTAEMAWRLA